MPKKEKKKKSRREKTKYPNIDPNMNIKARKDYLEGWRYVDGVKNDNGKEVIRPLTEEEREWLDKFEAETVVTDFYHTKNLKQLKKELDEIVFEVISNSNLGCVIELKKEIKLEKNKDIQKKLTSKLKRLCKKLGKDSDNERILDAKKRLQDVRDSECFYSDEEDQKMLYRENNTRNTCLYNHTKKSGDLIRLDLHEYDRFISERLVDIDPEDLMIGSETKKKKS